MESTIAVNREKIIDLLQRQHYQVYRIQPPEMDLCFELIAEHLSKQLPSLIIKVIENIDNIKPPYLHELKLLASLMRALPLLVAETNRRDPLEDNVVYNRKDIIAVNLKTFAGLLQNPALPVAVAKQGGFFHDIDGVKLQKLREGKNMTRKDLADRLEVTPKAISQYETNNMRASRDHTRIIEDLFGQTIIQSRTLENLATENPLEVMVDRSFERKSTAKNREFMKMINEIVEDTGFQTFWTRNSPYDLFIYQEDEESHQVVNFTFVGGTFYDKKADRQRVLSQEDFLLHQIKDPQAKAMIYNEEKVNPEEIKKETLPYIKPKELKYLDNPDEFKKLIRQRTKMFISWQ